MSRTIPFNEEDIDLIKMRYRHEDSSVSHDLIYLFYTKGKTVEVVLKEIFNPELLLNVTISSTDDGTQRMIRCGYMIDRNKHAYSDVVLNAGTAKLPLSIQQTDIVMLRKGDLIHVFAFPSNELEPGISIEFMDIELEGGLIVTALD